MKQHLHASLDQLWADRLRRQHRRDRAKAIAGGVLLLLFWGTFVLSWTSGGAS